MSLASAALYDYETGRGWNRHGDRWFHAASTIKIAVLACVYRALEEERADAGRRLEIRNRFASAVDGQPFSVPAERDTDGATHRAAGSSLPIGELARRMIAVSGNLATNVLLEFVGIARARGILKDAGITGIELVRGVEDDAAFEAGIWNRVTANGLAGLLRALLDGRFASPSHTDEILDLLSAQTFNAGIPAGLPPTARASARIAHKTGEISTATHDAGIVFLPGRAPYVLAVLTDASGADRYAPIAEMSWEVYERVIGRERRDG